MKIAVYTIYTNSYDKLRDPIFHNSEIDYFCFTDDRKFKSKIWKVIYLKNNFSNNRRNSRLHKIKPHQFLANYEFSLYIDSNVIIRGDIVEFINKYKHHLFSLFIHPYNIKSILEEANTIIQNKLDSNDIIKRQLKKYDNIIHDLNNYTFPCATILLRNHNHPNVIKSMNLWWNEYLNFSERDQMSILFAVYTANLKLNIINENVNNNNYFYKTKHYSKMNLGEKVCLEIMFFLKKYNYDYILKILQKYSNLFDKNF